MVLSAERSGRTQAKKAPPSQHNRLGAHTTSSRSFGDMTGLLVEVLFVLGRKLVLVALVPFFVEQLFAVVVGLTQASTRVAEVAVVEASSAGRRTA